MDRLLTHIENLYGLTSPSHNHKVERGILSENHVLESEGTRYFLKKYRPFSKERMQEIHAAKEFFREGGVPVIMPLKTKENTTFFEFEGSHYALFPFVEGIHIDRGHYTKEIAHEFGAMLGKIHKRGYKAKTKVSPGADFWNWNASEKVTQIDEILQLAERVSPKTEFDDYAIKTLRIKQAEVKESSVKAEDLGLDTSTLIHGDYLDHNVFFNNTGKLIAVFDWEKTEYAPRTHELWRCLAYAFIIGNDDPEELVLSKIFLDAYLTESPLEEKELRSGFELFYQKMIHSLWLEKEHYILSKTRADHLMVESFPRFQWLVVHHKDAVDLILNQPLR